MAKPEDQPEVGAEAPERTAAEDVAAGLDFVFDVPLALRVELGKARLLVRDVLRLSKGSVVELDRMSGEPVDLFVNDRLVARAEVTSVDDRLAVRITEIVGSDPLGGRS